MNGDDGEEYCSGGSGPIGEEVEMCQSCPPQLYTEPPERPIVHKRQPIRATEVKKGMYINFNGEIHRVSRAYRSWSTNNDDVEGYGGRRQHKITIETYGPEVYRVWSYATLQQWDNL